eukprot:1711224-Amphidinium_carterae.1
MLLETGNSNNVTGAVRRYLVAKPLPHPSRLQIINAVCVAAMPVACQTSHTISAALSSIVFTCEIPYRWHLWEPVSFTIQMHSELYPQHYR